jgi:hypothetical protein
MQAARSIDKRILASMLRLNLFTYRDLRRWLDNPFGTPPLVPLAEQLSFTWVE